MIEALLKGKEEGVFSRDNREKLVDEVLLGRGKK